MLIDEEEYLAHYGILRKSGRYPWGSGDTQGQRNKDFLDYVDGLKRQGLSEVEIARGLGYIDDNGKDVKISTTQLRAAKSIAKNEQKQAEINEARRLQEKGMSPTAIGKQMGKNESSVRALLAPGNADKQNVLDSTTNMLKKEVAEKQYIDIGSGVESQIGVAKSRLNTAVARLQEEGYKKFYIDVEQLGTGKMTTMKVLAPPDTVWSDVNNNRDKIRQIEEFSDDGGRTFFGIKPPLSIDPSRVGIRYAEDGGASADGVIYVRPGVSDVSLGNSRYAQVRVAVGGTHYLKGMAMYKDDLPAGVDLVFNTNKSNSGNKLDAMKPLKDDPDNPFGAQLKRQLIERDKDGKEVVTSSMNLVNEEGDWGNWSKNLSTQFLSKQSTKLAASQLKMTYDSKTKEFDEIMSLTNPTVRKKLLEEFADSSDSSAVHLKAASLPRQSNHVILPVDSVKENEIYAPTFNNGERVVLVRHPHGGTFEIPELTVNNKNPEARKLIGTSSVDAVGIHSKVAERLSGADFDGDTVLVIPNNDNKVKTTPALEGLKNFDTKAAYPAYDGMRTIDGGTYKASTKQVDYGGKEPTGGKGSQMGLVSNLITDMTIRGASHEELARALRHSMVVIDAEKHVLDYKQSAIDNNIRQLAEKYQNSSRGGASTLISRARSTVRVDLRKPRSAKKGGPIDKATGKKMFEDEPESFVDRSGKLVIKTRKSERLAETEDARDLSSGSTIETIYAAHSNRLKALANQARKEAINTKPNPYSPSAKKAYAKEVSSLDAKLNIAKKNQPRERQAQLVANTVVSAKRRSNPNMPTEELKRVKSQALAEARTRMGASKQDIIITPSEWTAIQAGAISSSKLSDILNNSNKERVKELAMPRKNLLMDSSMTSRAKTMLASGYTQAEVAGALGVSLTTLKTGIGG